MGQFDDKVERQRLLLEAEEWSRGVKGLHCHSLSSMWYDNRPEDTANGKSVMDIEYNGKLIKRVLEDGSVHYFGERLRGDDLIREYQRYNADKKRSKYVFV